MAGWITEETPLQPHYGRPKVCSLDPGRMTRGSPVSQIAKSVAVPERAITLSQVLGGADTVPETVWASHFQDFPPGSHRLSDTIASGQ